MRIAVLGHCQVHGYAFALRHLLPDAQVVAYELGVTRKEEKLPALAEALDGFDHVFTQPADAGFGPVATDALRPRLRNMHRLPFTVFAGYHPDIAYLSLKGQVWGSPVGAYHSALIAAAFSLGVPQADVPTLFNRLVFQALGHFEAFAVARDQLLQHYAECGLEMSAAVARWHARGPFMHTVNHPRAFVLADLMAATAARAGLLPADATPQEPSYDGLAADTIWPVYPELAAALGVPGSLLFKQHNRPVQPLGNSTLLNLREFVALSYEFYGRTPAEAFLEGDVGRARARLAERLGLG